MIAIKNAFIVFLWAEVRGVFFIWVLNLSPSSEAYRGAVYILVYTALIRSFMFLDFILTGDLHIFFI